MPDPFHVYCAVRVACVERPELRYKSWPDEKSHQMADHRWDNYFQGFCFIATQVFCHHVQDARPWSREAEHYWAVVNDTIWDPTADQFDLERLQMIYRQGRPGCRRSDMTERARALEENVSAWLQIPIEKLPSIEALTADLHPATV